MKFNFLTSVCTIGLLTGQLSFAPIVYADNNIYTYDTLGRLLSVCHVVANKLVSYSYDAAGNRTSKTVTSSCSGGSGGGANNPPNAVNDSGSGNQYDIIRLYALNNDSDPDGDSLTITGATCSSSGCSVSHTATYVDVVGITVGTKSVTYTISDGKGGTDTASITVTVNFDVCPLC